MVQRAVATLYYERWLGVLVLPPRFIPLVLSDDWQCSSPLLALPAPPPLSLSFFSSPKRRASSSTLQIFPSFRNFIHFSCQRILQLSVCLWKCRVVRPRRQFSLLPKTSLPTRLSRRNLSVYISRPNPVAQPVWILLVINEKERTTNGFAPSKMILLSRTFIRREEDLSNFPRNSKVRRARWESCAVKIIVFGEWIKRRDTFWCRRNKKKRE